MIKQILTTMMIAAGTTLAFAQMKNVGSFTKLKVFDQINVELIPGDEYKADISGKNAGNVEFVNSGNELKVRMVTSKVMQGDATKIILYYKNLGSIQASQGSIISSTSPITSSNLSLISNEGSVIDVVANSTAISSKVNTGGLIKIAGETTTQDVVVNAGGKYEGAELKSENTSVTVNAGGEANVFASQDVTTTTRAGGIINVYGNPENRNEKKVIGGKVNYK
ncbi:Putative auto-transporter adhesin, head GIN domain [Soonwooa buanensis]|uniref:Putative auto-transporter adhesin, head GIN domain n=1 Tax=Soonwooa buanensis TaxID=619805 RepID=A0A1T5CT30_9FLAO|nr:head GIN domain-containing protein [Soonwooa buanensis]SKB62481.1 Putative auto-transporter adhesin, head GIN domain [Soonwooa buanensis]